MLNEEGLSPLWPSGQSDQGYNILRMLGYWLFFAVVIAKICASDLSVIQGSVLSFQAQINTAWSLFKDSLRGLEGDCSFDAEPSADDQRFGLGDEEFWAKLDAHSSAVDELFEALVQRICCQGFSLLSVDGPLFVKLMHADISEAVHMFPLASSVRSYLKMKKITSYLRLRKLAEYLEGLEQQAKLTGGLELPSIADGDVPLRFAVSQVLHKSTKFSMTKQFLSKLPKFAGEAFAADHLDSATGGSGSYEYNDQALELAAFAAQTITELEKDFSELVVALYDLMEYLQTSQSAQFTMSSSDDFIELVVEALTKKMEFAPAELLDHLEGFPGGVQLCKETRFAYFRLEADIYCSQITLWQRLAELRVEMLGPMPTPGLSVESLPYGLVSLSLLFHQRLQITEKLLARLDSDRRVDLIAEVRNDFGHRQPFHPVMGLLVDQMTEMGRLITFNVMVGSCSLEALASALRGLVSLVRNGQRFIWSILDAARVPTPTGLPGFHALLQGGAARFLIASHELLSTLEYHNIALD